MSKKLLRPHFDEVLIPIGFRRLQSTWLRNNDETTFGVNIERQPMASSYWINLWIWLAPNIERHQDRSPEMAIWIEELLDAEQRGDFQLLSDFDLDHREPKEKAAQIALCLRDVGLPWLERFTRRADIRAVCRNNDPTLIRAMGAEWRTKCQLIENEGRLDV